MYEVTTDPARNLLKITFRDHVVPAELVQGRADVIKALTTLKPGFRLLTDLSELDSMDYACAAELKANMDFFRKSGVTEVVRVVPDPRKDIGFKIMSYFHYGRAVPVVTFETRTEAQAHLAAE